MKKISAIKCSVRRSLLALIGLGSMVLVGCLFPIDYFVLGHAGLAQGSTTDFPTYKILWPEQNAKFKMYCFDPSYQGTVPTLGQPSGWLYAFTNVIVGGANDITQITAILNEVVVSDSTGTLYTGKWGQNSTSIYAPDFRRNISPTSYCWGPETTHPGIPECSGTHTCKKAELFAVHISATTGQPDAFGPIFSNDTMNNCVINGNPSTVAGMVNRAWNSCTKERVLRVYLPIR